MSCIIHGAKARPQTASIEVFKSIWHGRPKGGLVENPGLSRRLLRRPYVGHGGLRLAMADPARHPTGIRRSPQRLERVSGIEPPSSAWKAPDRLVFSRHILTKLIQFAPLIANDYPALSERQPRPRGPECAAIEHKRTATRRNSPSARSPARLSLSRARALLQLRSGNATRRKRCSIYCRRSANKICKTLTTQRGKPGSRNLIRRNLTR